MISLRGLSKIFGDTTIIDDVSLNIAAGEFVGIVGESGAGKSTLLYLMSGLLAPTSGKVILDDLVISDLDDRELSKIRTAKIGFVFQFHNLIDSLSVRDNMELPLIMAQRNPRHYYDRIYTLVDAVGLAAHLDKLVATLSGGERQRVAIARALVNEPCVIFADEPTGSLDRKNTDAVVELLAKLSREHEVTVVMVTHSERTLCYCDRVIEMCDGRLQ